MMQVPRSLSATTPVVIGLVALTILVAGFGSWSVFAHVAGAIMTTSQVENTQDRYVIRHATGGVVAELDIREGQHVQKGDRLMRLQSDQISSTLADINAQLFDALAQSARVQAEYSGNRAMTLDPRLRAALDDRPELIPLIDAHQSTLDASLSDNALIVGKMQAYQSQLKTQIKTIEQELAALVPQMRPQDSGALFPTIELQSLQREFTEQKTALETKLLNAELALLNRREKRLETGREKSRQLQSLIAKLERKRNALMNQLSKLEIRAPISGYVYALSVRNSRSVIQPKQSLLYIIPGDQAHVIIARLDPRHINNVYLGQDVYLRFGQLDAENTPELTAKISNISYAASGNANPSQRYYRIEISPAPENADAFQNLALQPGMSVETYIKTNSQSPIEYLLKPVSGYFSRALREN